MADRTPAELIDRLLERQEKLALLKKQGAPESIVKSAERLVREAEALVQQLEPGVFNDPVVWAEVERRALWRSSWDEARALVETSLLFQLEQILRQLAKQSLEAGQREKYEQAVNRGNYQRAEELLKQYGGLAAQAADMLQLYWEELIERLVEYLFNEFSKHRSSSE